MERDAFIRAGAGIPVSPGGEGRILFMAAIRASRFCYCRSYSPLPIRLSTLKPAFLASEIESGLSFIGELNAERILRTGFLQAGQCVSGDAERGRCRVNLPPQTLQLPSHNSYS